MLDCGVRDFCCNFALRKSETGTALRATTPISWVRCAAHVVIRNRVLGDRCWVLGDRCWVLGDGGQVIGVRLWVFGDGAH